MESAPTKDVDTQNAPRKLLTHFCLDQIRISGNIGMVNDLNTFVRFFMPPMHYTDIPLKKFIVYAYILSAMTYADSWIPGPIRLHLYLPACVDVTLSITRLYFPFM